MKLRLRENSIRLRLLQSEIRRLRETGKVSEKIVFGANPAETLVYSLLVSSQTKKIYARMSANQIEVFLPQTIAENWIDTEEISLHQTQKIGDSVELKILVEKDFICADRPSDADNFDAFSPPKTAKAR